MKKIKKKNNNSLITNILFSIIALFAVTVSIIFLLLNYSLKSEIQSIKDENDFLLQYKDNHPYSEDDISVIKEEVKKEQSDEEKQILLSQIKDIMNNGYSAYYLMRNLYPDDVVVMADSKYLFFPIDDSMKKNNYDINNFVQDEETKEVSYIDPDNKVKTKKGIDVSSFNGKIDWSKVKKDGIDFAFIRVGYRGSTEGALKLDTTFEYNIQNAIKNGIDVGVYFFTQAINEDEAIKEAQFVMDAIEPYQLTYPVVYDVEAYQGGRAENIGSEQQTKNTIAFLDTVKNSGYEPMVYSNLNGLFVMQDIKKLESYKKWFAYYIYPMYYPYDLYIWQYSSSGKVSGISGDVDMNICFKNE